MEILLLAKISNIINLQQLSSILLTLIIFGIIVLIHEFGHFIFAVKSGVLVEEFAIGMGPKIFGIQKGETLYTIRLFPLGGYCKMLGEDENNINEKSFNSKSISKRFWILMAGSLFNFILALVVFFVMNLLYGYTNPIVKEVLPNSPAQEAGLKTGDKIIGINNKKVNITDDLMFYLSLMEGNKITLKIKNENGIENKSLIPFFDEESKTYRIGFAYEQQENFSKNKNKIKSVLESAKISYYKILFNVKFVLITLGNLFTGKVSFQNMMGPIGMVKVVGETVRESSTVGFSILMANILNFLALISANLAVFNLLPFPALDGGRILFLAIEKVRGRPVSPSKEGLFHFVGFVAFMILAIVVAISDIKK